VLPKIEAELHWSADVAKPVADQIHIIGSAFNELTLLIGSGLPEDEQKEARKFLGSLMVSLVSEMLMPLEKMHPHARRDDG